MRAFKKSIRIDDCYNMPDDAPCRFNQELDRENNYKTKSLLTVPMITSEGQVRA